MSAMYKISKRQQVNDILTLKGVSSVWQTRSEIDAIELVLDTMGRRSYFTEDDWDDLLDEFSHTVSTYTSNMELLSASHRDDTGECE